MTYADFWWWPIALTRFVLWQGPIALMRFSIVGGGQTALTLRQPAHDPSLPPARHASAQMIASNTATITSTKASRWPWWPIGAAGWYSVQ